MLNKLLNLDCRTSVADTGDQTSPWATGGGRLDFIYYCSKAVAFKLLSVCKPQRFHLCRCSPGRADKGFSLIMFFQTDRGG